MTRREYRSLHKCAPYIVKGLPKYILAAFDLMFISFTYLKSSMQIHCLLIIKSKIVLNHDSSALEMDHINMVDINIYPIIHVT